MIWRAIKYCQKEKNLTEVIDNRVYLKKEKTYIYHNYMIKLLFLCKGSRRNILTAVLFLPDRVNNQIKTTTGNWLE